MSTVEQHLVERIATMADTCLDCGKVHTYRERTECCANRWTWADPIDGHPYRRTMPRNVGLWLRSPVLTALAKEVIAMGGD
jgi:hypothetical protein